MKRRTHDIAQGQLYRKTGRAGDIWEVVAVKADASGAIHARLKSVEQPTTFRTFAIEAVLDARNFQLIESKTV